MSILRAFSRCDRPRHRGRFFLLALLRFHVKATDKCLCLRVVQVDVPGARTLGEKCECPQRHVPVFPGLYARFRAKKNDCGEQLLCHCLTFEMKREAASAFCVPAGLMSAGFFFVVQVPNDCR